MRLKKWRAFPLTVAVFAVIVASIVLMPLFTPSELYSDLEKLIPAEPTVSVDGTVSELPEQDNDFAESIDDVVSTEGFAYGLYIDNEFICACTDKAAIESALAALLDLKTKSFGIDGALNSEFSSEIDIVGGNYPPDCRVSADGIKPLLGINDQQSATFEITDVYGNLLELNVSVITYAHCEGNEPVRFDTETVYTDLKRDGVTSVVTEGVDGEAYVVCDRVYVDGELVSTDYIKNDIIKQPVNEVVMIGVASTVMDTAAFDGFFANPTDSGYWISSGYGGRELGGASDSHSGIDLVKIGDSCNKEPAYASADGVVIYASSRSSFGNLVIIKHTDRISTYYAHLHSISVKVGDIVKQGQEIGKIGSTGNSTGPHLHFEIRLDDSPVNPQKFLDYKRAY